MKRNRYEIRPTSKKEKREYPARGAWTVTKNGALVEFRDTQKAAIKIAVHIAVHALKARGELGTLKIKGRNGRIRDERTYGADPRRTKG